MYSFQVSFELLSIKNTVKSKRQGTERKIIFEIMYPKELSDLGCEKKTKDQYEQNIQINRKIDESVEQTLHKRRLQKTKK